MEKQIIYSHQSGIIAVYKPKGPSSHLLINRMRLVTGVRRIGHAGTLDPLADGVMIVGITREFTKKLMLYKNQPKQYLATVKLGWSSTTDDESGAKTAGGTNPVSLEDVISA